MLAAAKPFWLTDRRRPPATQQLPNSTNQPACLQDLRLLIGVVRVLLQDRMSSSKAKALEGIPESPKGTNRTKAPPVIVERFVVELRAYRLSNRD